MNRWAPHSACLARSIPASPRVRVSSKPDRLETNRVPYSTCRYKSTLRTRSKYRMSGAEKHTLSMFARLCSHQMPSNSMYDYAVLAVFLWRMPTNCVSSVYVRCNDPDFCPSSNEALRRTVQQCTVSIQVLIIRRTAFGTQAQQQPWKLSRITLVEECPKRRPQCPPNPMQDRAN